MGTADWLFDHSVDDFQLQQLLTGDPHRFSGIFRLGRITVKYGSAAFRRNHRIDGMLHHQHMVCRRNRDRAARATFADDQRDDGHIQGQTPFC